MKVVAVLCFFAAVSAASAALSFQCRDCICRAEGCETNSLTCNGQALEACGPYQITLSYFCDANNYPASTCYLYESEWRNCMQTWQCNNATVDSYMARYGTYCSGVPSPTCQTYAKVHKGGPEGCQAITGAPVTFWNTVNQCCNSRWPGQCN